MSRIGLRSPDEHGLGLSDAPLGALRYDSHSSDPWETPGLLRKRMPRGVRVLDIGCGTGSITLQVNKGLGNNILGVEPDQDRARLARERGIEVISGYADSDFFASHGLFDVIVFSDVLEHLASPSDMIMMASEALAPGGKILASIPNVAHWSVRLRLLIGRFDYTDIGIMDATHLRWFTARTACQLFEKCGFRITSLQWSAGAWMREYRKFPFGFIPPVLREAAIHGLTRFFPRLFGCQHIIEAVPNTPTTPPLV